MLPQTPVVGSSRFAALALPCLFAPLAMAGVPQFIQETASRFPTQSEYSNQLTMGDIDGDGDLDVLFANGGNFGSPGTPQKIRVYINDGTGVFTDDTDNRTGGVTGLCRGVELGDIEQDGDLDVIVVQDFARRPILLVNDGNGFFTSEGTARGLLVILSSSRGQFGDTDNDGDLDLFFITGGSDRFGCGQYRLYENDGAGFFSDVTASTVPIGNVCSPMDAIFGDIDNDFDMDIRTASLGSGNSKLYVNNGLGVFSLSGSIPNDSTCYSYDLGDMDGDGDLDMFGANAGSGNTDLLLENTGVASGSYINVSGQLSSNPNVDDNDSVFLDWDDDGDLDLMVARLGGTQERTYVNDGVGNFFLSTNVISNQSDSSLDIKAGDVDNDGDYDIITAQGESGNFQNRIYINNGPADTTNPTIVDTEQVVVPEGGVPGDYVVRALILDSMTSDRNFFDKGIAINYSQDGGPVEQVPMIHSGGQIYRGVIPCGVTGTVEYFVTAIDWNDNVGTGPTLSFEAPGLPGDVNSDGTVDGVDLVDVILAWGPCPDPPAACPADTDNSGTVGGEDVVSVILAWGTSCP